MIFNIWKHYPKRKPRKDGWYQCKLKDGTVVRLFYVTWADRWSDTELLYNNYSNEVVQWKKGE